MKCLMVMIYLSANYTDKQKSPTVLLVCWGPARKPLFSQRLCSGVSELFPTGSCSSSFPSRTTFAVLCRKSPLLPGSPSYSWKDIRVSKAEPGPESSAGRAGTRCLLLFVMLYFPFPCLEFGGPKPASY